MERSAQDGKTAPARPAGAGDEEYLAGIAREHAASVHAQRDFGPAAQPGERRQSPAPGEPALVDDEERALLDGPAAEVSPPAGGPKRDTPRLGTLVRSRPRRRRGRRRGLPSRREPSPAWRLVVQILLVGAMTALAVAIYCITRS